MAKKSKYYNAILDFIKESKNPVSYTDIEKGINQARINKTTIYRILNRLVEENQIYKIGQDGDRMTYFKSHQHFINCQNCNKYINIEHETMHEIEDFISSIENKLKYKNDLSLISHKLTFITNCNACTK